MAIRLRLSSAWEMCYRFELFQACVNPMPSSVGADLTMLTVRYSYPRYTIGRAGKEPGRRFFVCFLHNFERLCPSKHGRWASSSGRYAIDSK